MGWLPGPDSNQRPTGYNSYLLLYFLAFLIVACCLANLLMRRH